MIRLFKMLKGELMVLIVVWLRSLLPWLYEGFLATFEAKWFWLLYDGAMKQLDSIWTSIRHQLDHHRIAPEREQLRNCKNGCARVQFIECVRANTRQPEEKWCENRAICQSPEIFENYAESSEMCDVILSLCTPWNRFWMDFQLPGAWRPIHYWRNWKRRVCKQICRFSHQIRWKVLSIIAHTHG